MTSYEWHARDAITQQIYRYCRAVDRLDVELGRSVFHPDSHATFGSYDGSGRGWIDYICARHRAFDGHSHQVSNILIDLSEKSAGSESYVTATLLERGALHELQFFARYIDRWSLREGVWAIDTRECVTDFATRRRIEPLTISDAGRRDRHDPSYAVL